MLKVLRVFISLIKANSYMKDMVKRARHIDFLEFSKCREISRDIDGHSEWRHARFIGDKDSLITHWGRMTHICVVKLTIIGVDNDLSPGRRQAIFWTNSGM